MGRYHCSEHGIEYSSVCPACVRDQAEEDRQSILSSLSEQTEEVSERLDTLLYKQSNPGDYKCPECYFITLKKGAKRCPMCRSSISEEYWKQVAEKEEETRKRKAEIEEKQRQATEEQKRKAQEEKERIVRGIREAKKEWENKVDLVFALLIGFGLLILFVVAIAFTLQEVANKIMSWFS
ncbi:MAG: hypothetical protein A3F53_01675 [Candidatus Zambryskibacteria bacterium RIFCSPHIGHO2_12_FULL_48_10]|uniref:Uncharacterized protein n=1 Tax=Candidatus Zambryskibacteria bacterium RIFCSPHIGHO2_01_FULL_46_25 TaxID=1802738 RepID=A0A1G2SYE3_9BACT|nr:MAG: hypothetical protein UX71_C0002G0230 [Parcubacteria group bacterium GW2011_GWA1_47_10]OHA90057.1 MAG: hypothetical protein A2838_00255 [Candidatus Zambryskibacteria bacterium RIFCSPHIGHO2_01_FULL_46_25]OHB02654.1 MAG: hypothetical protein A3F53_01675 [Candidatus Zambryskibacteria bacterium RIFCSPHIGHO2_12_FULL_48_10]OHB06568.1 MAG: hypothetical protein A3A31_03000 [Candidatus Zambryskibacteria bacterium RIFCSPLOWO2_01_FULL_48_25]